ncbi:hypothetical protein PRIPAC_94151 [Pristionchus pacificus]|uniref:Uncharacterized protein n=1 Tax=Pristionchus pacificus TaxID=54126 RepID=A0A2A6BB57_PRIPA|nr:hypothetical protein PRIPAC_94151 [Pristionchus pacificus]|eukprot:PDM63081.1 hypothetical protein PRIPAC_50296 [Pristionchus pacificus]
MRLQIDITEASGIAIILLLFIIALLLNYIIINYSCIRGNKEDNKLKKGWRYLFHITPSSNSKLLVRNECPEQIV